MNIRPRIFIPLIASGLVPLMMSAIAAAATLDRDYSMGDDTTEGASNGNAVGSGNPDGKTYDSWGLTLQGQLVDLTPVNMPTYVAISGRPDGVGGRGIQFNAAQQQYLHGFNLGFPNDSFSSSAHTTVNGGNLDYAGISNRGLQFWARPTSTAVQTLVMDTNQHGVRINSNGKFSMRYANVDYESNVSVVPNSWYHIEVVRPAGAANGSRLYINGNAVAIALGGYDNDWADLVVGANTAGDDGGTTHPDILSPVGFTGGTSEFYSGIIDDLKMFVIGTSTSTTPTNWGTFNFAVDNQFVASPTSGIKGIAGDVDNNGSLGPSDKTAFIAGWMKTRLVNGVQIGDMTSRSQGDLNLDGITNIQDLLLLQNALIGAGLGTITSAELAGVPEPSAVVLAIVAGMPLMLRRKMRRRG